MGTRAAWTVAVALFVWTGACGGDANPGKGAEAVEGVDAGADSSSGTESDASIVADPGGADAAAPRNSAGTHHHTMVVDGMEREFIVYVPAAADGVDDVPVVFMVHGTGQSGQEFYDKGAEGWTGQCDKVGCIAVFPTSLTYCYFDYAGLNAQGDRRVSSKWVEGWMGNPAKYPLCGPDVVATLTPKNQEEVDHPLADDVKFFDEMVAFLQANYAVDRRRIYGTGFSNGAAMIQRLVVERSEVFAAMAANSGSMAVEPAPSARPMSVMFTYGNADATNWANAPMPFHPLAIDTYLASYVSRLLITLQLEDAPTFSQDTVAGQEFMRWVYDSSTAGASNRLEVFLVKGHPHTYPAFMPPALWPFFSQFSLP